VFSSTRVTGREEETLVVYLPVKIAGAEESGGQREGDARVKVREGTPGSSGTCLEEIHLFHLKFVTSFHFCNKSQGTAMAQKGWCSFV